jgi:hypothetical protein
MDVVEERSMKLVSLEGDAETISLQLRLLPPSQKILILPSLLQDVLNDTDESFSARSFVRRVHAALTQRIEIARTFLQASTAAQPRLVFMNGGSVTARTVCISRICETLANWNVEEAESIFNELVKDGVAGLMKDDEVAFTKVSSDGSEAEEEEENALSSTGVLDYKVTGTTDTSRHSQLTAGLESVDEEGARAATPEIKNDLLPGNPSDDKEPTTREITAPRLEDSFPSPPQGRIIKTVITTPDLRKNIREERESFGARPVTMPPRFFTAPAYQSEDGSEDEEDINFSGQDSMLSASATFGVIYGEACIVDIQATPPSKSAKKARSFENCHSKNSTLRKVDLDAIALKQPKRPISDGWSDKESAAWRFSMPAATFMKASETTIRRSPIASPRPGSSSLSKSMLRVFVDKGTDARDDSIEIPAMASEVVEVDPAPFEAVFPIVEDLVIHFTSEISNEIFDCVLRSYRTGTSPICSEMDSEAPPASPLSDSDTLDVQHKADSHFTAETDDEGIHGAHEFDPYSSNENYTPNRGKWAGQRKTSRHDSAIQNVEPPTPSTTPPPPISGVPGKFCQFNPGRRDSVISVQNSLRAFLALYFPAGETGYTQHCFPVIPEADRLWKPVWSCDERDIHEARTVDEIIALGCEDGVGKDFFSQVSGQIEKLGTKRSGINRSGKLDLRYLFS